MSYFSRLTDIVTCNLTQLLAQAEDPRAAISEIIQEMREGVAGAQRRVSTAVASEERLRLELEPRSISGRARPGSSFRQGQRPRHGNVC